MTIESPETCGGRPDQCALTQIVNAENKTSELAAAPAVVQRVVRSTLELTLKKKWFDMVASGEKREEYREPSHWILSRLQGRQYDVVRFRNGYSPKSPVCVCEYKGWGFGNGKPKWGGDLDIIIIKLGRVLNWPSQSSAPTSAK